MPTNETELRRRQMKAMSDKVLVAYGSKHGATAEIAEAIGQVIRDRGRAVDVLRARDVGDLSPYAAVVLGSAVYVGAWRKECVKFLKAHTAELAQRPVWIFSSGPTGEGDPLELLNGWTLPGAQQSIVDRIAPRDIAVFHGSVDVAKLGVIERQMIKMVKAPSGDYRDWEAIRAWASGIASGLPG
jgi:menaquinone-dependent protoporphyrinogen oxidase